MLQNVRNVQIGRNAMITVTVSQAREKLSDLLGKVQHGREDVTIERHGKPVAVMISVEAMAYYEALEDAELAKLGNEAYAEYLADPGKSKTLTQYLAEAAANDAAE
jgi:prevent-host-death family protein